MYRNAGDEGDTVAVKIVRDGGKHRRGTVRLLPRWQAQLLCDSGEAVPVPKRTLDKMMRHYRVKHGR